MQSSYRHFEDPFDADKVIVLNSHTKKWLQLNLAAKNGVMANPQFADWKNRDLRIPNDSPLIRMGCSKLMLKKELSPNITKKESTR